MTRAFPFVGKTGGRHRADARVVGLQACHDGGDGGREFTTLRKVEIDSRAKIYRRLSARTRHHLVTERAEAVSGYSLLLRNLAV
jgi:hypothetical protein